MRSKRLAAALVAGIVVPLIAAGTAEAGEKWSFRASGSNASVDWVEYGELPGIPGNIHIGSLWVDSSSRFVDVFGEVTDWTCPPGEFPDGGGHFEEEPEESNCEFEALRFIEGGDVSFTMDRKLGSAHLTGTLSVENHSTGGGAAPPVDITWTGLGSVRKSTEKFREVSKGQRFEFRYRTTSRDATVDGFIGAMGFTDDTDDESFGSMSKYRVHDRFVSK